MGKRWIVDRLKECGLLQRDLAAAWGIAEGGVSRWLNSDELSDLPLSRASKLSEMLRIPLNDLALRLGFAAALPPTTKAVEVAAELPLGTFVYSEGPDETALFAIHARLTDEGRGTLKSFASYVRLNTFGDV